MPKIYITRARHRRPSDQAWARAIKEIFLGSENGKKKYFLFFFPPRFPQRPSLTRFPRFPYVQASAPRFHVIGNCYWVVAGRELGRGLKLAGRKPEIPSINRGLGILSLHPKTENRILFSGFLPFSSPAVCVDEPFFSSSLFGFSSGLRTI